MKKKILNEKQHKQNKNRHILENEEKQLYVVNLCLENENEKHNILNYTDTKPKEKKTS